MCGVSGKRTLFNCKVGSPECLVNGRSTVGCKVDRKGLISAFGFSFEHFVKS